MGESRRELNKIKIHKRILKASRKLFSSKGYEETMMEDIAQKAEVSKATVYNYFDSKESLLVGIVDEQLERTRSFIETGLTNCSNSEQKLRLVLEEFVKASVDYPSLSRRITYLNSCENNQMFRELIHLFHELVSEAQEEEIFRVDANPNDIVDIIMSLFLLAQFQWLDIESYSEKQLHDKLQRFFTMMLKDAYSPERKVI